MTTHKHVSIRFLVGLASPQDPLDPAQATLQHKGRRARVEALLTRAYDVGAFYYGAGVWKGTGEPCLSFETIQPDDERERERARAIGREIRAELEQEAVGLVFTPVDFELV